MNNIETLKRAAELLRDSVQYPPERHDPEFRYLREETEQVAAALEAMAAQPQQAPEDWQFVPKNPTEAQWSGLARDIVMWMDMHPGASKTPRALFTHLERLGVEAPDWLRNEPEMKALDHVPSKGTRAVIIYRAMLADAPKWEGK